MSCLEKGLRDSSWIQTIQRLVDHGARRGAVERSSDQPDWTRKKSGGRCRHEERGGHKHVLGQVDSESRRAVRHASRTTGGFGLLYLTLTHMACIRECVLARRCSWTPTLKPSMQKMYTWAPNYLS